MVHRSIEKPHRRSESSPDMGVAAERSKRASCGTLRKRFQTGARADHQTQNNKHQNNMLSHRIGSHAARSFAAVTATNRRLFSGSMSMSAATGLLNQSNKTKQRLNIGLGVMGGLLLAGLHSATGSQNEFFDYRFTAAKSPDDLASFYGVSNQSARLLSMETSS